MDRQFAADLDRWLTTEPEVEEAAAECASCGSPVSAEGDTCSLCQAFAFAPAPPADDAVFVYGTLRPGCGNDGLWRGQATSTPAVATGIRLVGLGRAFPYALEVEDPDEAAECLVYGDLVIPEPGSDVLVRMDWLEGVPTHYRRTTVVVDVGGVIRSAWVYVAASTERVAHLAPVPGQDWRNVR